MLLHNPLYRAALAGALLAFCGQAFAQETAREFYRRTMIEAGLDMALYDKYIEIKGEESPLDENGVSLSAAIPVAKRQDLTDYAGGRGVRATFVRNTSGNKVCVRIKLKQNQPYIDHWTQDLTLNFMLEPYQSLQLSKTNFVLTYGAPGIGGMSASYKSWLPDLSLPGKFCSNSPDKPSNLEEWWQAPFE